MTGKIIRHNNEDTFVDLLKQIKEVLDRHGIEFWLEGGTLLGAIREASFIPWDTDIDVGTWDDIVSDSIKVSIAGELRERGLKAEVRIAGISVKKGVGRASILFYRKHDEDAVLPWIPKRLLGVRLYQFLIRLTGTAYYGTPTTGHIIKRLFTTVAVNAVRPVFFLLRRVIAGVLSRIYQTVGSGEIIWWVVPSSYFRDLSTIKFYGMEFRAPAKAEEYLAYRYGKDWRIPNPNHVTLTDDGAMQSRGRSSARRKKKL